MEQFVVERLPFGVNVPINLKVEMDKDAWADHITARVRFFLDGMKDTEQERDGVTRETGLMVEIVSYPDGWWQAFKERWLTWMEVRYKEVRVPVTIIKERKNVINITRICPHGATGAVSDEERYVHLNWLRGDAQ